MILIFGCLSYTCTCRLNYTNGRYLDAQNVTISTSNFGSLSSLADLAPFFPASNETNFIEYLEQRGYRLDGNLRAAPFDWRLGAGMPSIHYKQVASLAEYIGLSWQLISLQTRSKCQNGQLTIRIPTRIKNKCHMQGAPIQGAPILKSIIGVSLSIVSKPHINGTAIAELQA